jgi:hypothetical protein
MLVCGVVDLLAEGLAIIIVARKHGFIDLNGKISIPPQFDAIKTGFSGGLAAASSHRRWGFVDKERKMDHKTRL